MISGSRSRYPRTIRSTSAAGSLSCADAGVADVNRPPTRARTTASACLRIDASIPSNNQVQRLVPYFTKRRQSQAVSPAPGVRLLHVLHSTGKVLEPIPARIVRRDELARAADVELGVLAVAQEHRLLG